VRPGVARIPAERAVSAIVAAEIRQGEEHLARVGDYARLEALFRGARMGEQRREIFIGATDQD